MDILRGAAAPYLLTLLVSVFSWLFLEIRKDLSEVAILSYETEISEQDGGVVEILTITNLSDKATLNGGTVDLLCPNLTICFTKNAQTGGEIARDRPGSPWSIRLDPSSSDRLVSFDLTLPPNSSASLEMSLVSRVDKPVFGFGYKPDGPNNTPVLFANQNRLYAFLAQWYHTLTMVVLVSAALALLVWLGRMMVSREKKAVEDPPRIALTVVLPDGRPAAFELLLVQKEKSAP
jgi:hypothetical protein